jgi:hypothetical protein
MPWVSGRLSNSTARPVIQCQRENYRESSCRTDCVEWPTYRQGKKQSLVSRQTADCLRTWTRPTAAFWNIYSRPRRNISHLGVGRAQLIGEWRLTLISDCMGVPVGSFIVHGPVAQLALHSSWELLQTARRREWNTIAIHRTIILWPLTGLP